jgi:hypothetical protein
MDIESFKTTMQKYRDMGESVPDYVFERIDREMNPHKQTPFSGERGG